MTSQHVARLARFASRVDAGLGIVACLILFCMMALTFVDVLARYLANHSVPGSFEITEIMMAVLIFAGLPLVSRREEHVTVDLIDHVIGSRMRHVHRALIEFVSGALLLGLGRLLWGKAQQTAAYGDTTTILEIRLAPFVYAMMAFVVLAAIVHLVKAFAPSSLGEPRGDRTA